MADVDCLDVTDARGRKAGGCGFSCWQPRCLRKLADVRVLAVVGGAASLTSLSIVVYFSSQLTTIERQFGLSSTVSGFLLGCNDIGFLVSTLVVSHFASRSHMPRIMGASLLVLGLSAILMTTPHVLFGHRQETTAVSKGGNSSRYYEPLCGLESGDNCQRNNLTRLSDSRFLTAETFWQAALAIMAVCLIAQGLASSVLHPYLMCYVDSVNKTKTGLYMGVIVSLKVFGAPLAHALASLVGRLYVTLEDRKFSYQDPNWIGAWWLGFLVLGSAVLIMALPVGMFPRQLVNKPPPCIPGQQTAKNRNVLEGIKDFLRSVLRLTRSPTFVLVTLGLCFQRFSSSISWAFRPKYIETQFSLPAATASLTMARITGVASAGGILIGGILTSRFKMAEGRSIKFIVIVELAVILIFSLGFVLGCPQPQIIGTSLPGHNPVWNGHYPPEVNCTNTCMCSRSDFYPVCSKQGNSYFSPCTVGCSRSGGNNVTGCACLEEPSVQIGACPGNCHMLYPYAAMVVLSSLLSGMDRMPRLLAIIRSVKDRDKALAVGASEFAVNLFGKLLGPIVFGRVIDSTCLLWKKSCDKKGACALYDLSDFRVKYHVIVISMKSVSLLLYLVCLYLYVRRQRQGRGPGETVEVDIAQQESPMLASSSPTTPSPQE